MCVLFFFNDTATTEIYTLSLHDALPIWSHRGCMAAIYLQRSISRTLGTCDLGEFGRSYEILRETNIPAVVLEPLLDRKSTRLNSSHANISYAVFCLKKKNFGVGIGSAFL